MLRLRLASTVPVSAQKSSILGHLVTRRLPNRDELSKVLIREELCLILHHIGCYTRTHEFQYGTRRTHGFVYKSFNINML